MKTDTYEEITYVLEDGRKVYQLNADFIRYAPAAVCQVSHRIKLLRKILNEHTDIDPNLKRKLEQVAQPLPFEKGFDSGCLLTVHNSIKELGCELMYEH